MSSSVHYVSVVVQAGLHLVPGGECIDPHTDPQVLGDES